MLATDRIGILAALSLLCPGMPGLAAAQANEVALPARVGNLAHPRPPAEATIQSPSPFAMIVDGSIAPPTPYQLQIYSTHVYTDEEIAADSARDDSDPAKKHLAAYAPFELIHRCGAVYIGDMWALTAAHCLLGVPGNLFTARRVRGGTRNLTYGGTTFRIETAVLNDGYWGNEIANDKRNDIALLKLAADASTDAQIAATLQPIRIMDVSQGDTALKVPDTFKITGWGVTSPREAGSNFGLNDEILHSSSRLRQVEMDFVPQADCAQVPEYQDTLGPQMICGGSNIGQRDTCRGDSGGPVVHTQGTEPLLVGLVVAGIGCGQGVPALYTYVPYFRDWIERAKDIGPGQFIYLP